MEAFEATLRIPRTSESCEAEIVVVQSSTAIPLLGALSSLELGVIELCKNKISKVDATPASVSRDQLIKEFADVFDETLGRLDTEARFTADQIVTPVKMPLRRIPLVVKDEVEEELLRLENLGIITTKHDLLTGSQVWL